MSWLDRTSFLAESEERSGDENKQKRMIADQGNKDISCFYFWYYKVNTQIKVLITYYMTRAYAGPGWQFFDATFCKLMRHLHMVQGLPSPC